MKGVSKQSAVKIKAAESIIGAIIGVGMFGIPFAFVQAGFFLGMVYLLILGLVSMIIFMMFAEVAIQTPGRHRISGYVKKYFGEKWGLFAAFVMIGSTWGGLIAYILVGGEFLHALFGYAIGGSLLTYQLLFMAVGFVIALRGLAFVARTEAYLVAALIFVVLIFVIRGMLDVDATNYFSIQTNDFILPYGVILFSLGGLNVIPEIKDMLGRQKKHLRDVIPWSFIVIVAVYAAFASVVVGITGSATTPESITGLGIALGPWVLILGSIMGLLAVATSFILMSVELQDMLEFDFGYTRLLSWFVTLSAPVIIFLLGARNFIEVMGFTGAVFGGLTGILVIAMYLRVRKRLCTTPVKCFAIPRWISFAILILFVAGIITGI